MNDLPENNQINEEVQMEDKHHNKNVLFLIVFLLFVFVSSYFLWAQEPIENYINKINPSNTSNQKLETFSSSEEFLSYINKGDEVGSGVGFGVSRTFEALPTVGMDNALQETSLSSVPKAERVSETNVQVLGIDEPDIVKTDGENIYISSDMPVLYKAMPEPLLIESDEAVSTSIAPIRVDPPKTQVINAFPPSKLESLSEIDEVGNMLLSNTNLVIFGNEKIFAYDVSNPSSPSASWEIEIGDNTSIHSSRLLNDYIYVITSTYISHDNPCPILPLSYEGGLIPCSSIYHPIAPIQTDTTYTAMKIDVKTGEVIGSISFVGSTESSVVYMSNNSIYITYTSYGDYSEYLYGFFNSLGTDLVSSKVKSSLKRLSGYELSSQAKMIEIQSIMEDYYQGLSQDEKRRIENEINNKMKDYATDKMREMEKTGIVKISASDMSITSNGEVPGHPLNQFSLDEYNDKFRIATSVGGNRFDSSESANDVYVLDKNLKVEGKLLNMGIDERIYSARFMGDLAYLVTFKQIDPFYVLDLSDSKNPQVKGELKIPGFSSYLHPIAKNMILGIGREDSKVKLSLFDVSKPNSPSEKDKYLLDAYWTDVSNSHHAFLQDEDKKIFFMPAGQDGYIFSYEQDSLTLKKVVSDINPLRSVYLDDYLYVIGNEELVVLDETNWEKVNEISY